MTRASSIAVIAGAFGAVLLVAFFKSSILGLLIGALLSPLPLAMAVFGLGTVYLPVAVVGGAVTVMALTGSFVIATVYLVVDAAPVAMLARLVYARPLGEAPKGADIGKSVAFFTMGAIALVVAGLLLMPSAGEGIEAALRARLGDVMADMPALPNAGIDLTTARAELVRAFAGLLPSAAVWNWALRTLVSVALAQTMLQRMGYALWATPSYRRFAVPNWFFLVLAGTAALALVLKGDPRFVASNAAIALCLPPVLQGLALVHCGIARLRHPKLALAIFYGCALALPNIFLAGLVAGGVMEQFFQLRGRYLAVQAGGE